MIQLGDASICTMRAAFFVEFSYVSDLPELRFSLWVISFQYWRLNEHVHVVEKIVHLQVLLFYQRSRACCVNMLSDSPVLYWMSVVSRVVL